MKRWITTFVLFLNTLTTYADEAPKRADVRDGELRRQLLQRMKVDQDARTVFVSWLNKHGMNGVLNTDGQSAQEKVEFE